MNQGISNVNLGQSSVPTSENSKQAPEQHPNPSDKSSNQNFNFTSSNNATTLSFGSSNTKNGPNTFSFQSLATDLAQTHPNANNRPMNASGANSLPEANSNSVKPKPPAQSNTAHTIVFTNSSFGHQSQNQTARNRSAIDVVPNDDASPADRSLLSKMTNKKLSDMPGYVAEQLNISSPLYSIKSFEELGLKPELLRAIAQMGFRKPSKIQEMTLPRLLAQPKQNIIAQSQSGTGKTGAFSLTILSKIDPNLKHPQALLLAPTYELALQIGQVIQTMAEFLPYAGVAYAVRQDAGNPRFTRGQLLKEPIVVGTPGTVEEWCLKQRVIDLSRLTMFCIDEADIMMDTEGFQSVCSRLIEKLDQEKCQLMLFSATYSDVVLDFVKNCVPNPATLRLKRQKQALPNIHQYNVLCENEEAKFNAIELIYGALPIGQGIIFCRTKRTARDLHCRLANQHHSVRELTSDLDMQQRAAVINLFRENGFRVLISTNVTSRGKFKYLNRLLGLQAKDILGIDIDDMTLVINYDMPVHRNGEPDHETYLHRIGRCGRFGKIGYAFNLVSSETDMAILNSIQEYFEKPIEKIELNDILALNVESA